MTTPISWFAKYALHSGDEQLIRGVATGHDMRRTIREHVARRFLPQGIPLAPNAVWEPRPDPSIYALDMLEQLRVAVPIVNELALHDGPIRAELLEHVLRIGVGPKARRFTGCVVVMKTEGLADLVLAFEAEQGPEFDRRVSRPRRVSSSPP